MTRFTQSAPRRALGHIALAVVGAAAVTVAAPALAQASSEAAPASAAFFVGNNAGGAAAPSTRRNRAENGERRICVDAALTGSRMPRRICKTEREWEATGGLDGITDR